MPFRSLLSRLSISTRLALWYGLSLLILLTLFVAGLYTVLHVGLHRTFNDRLREEAETVRRHLQAHGPDVHALSRSQGTSPRSGAFIRLLSAEGEVLNGPMGAGAATFAPSPPGRRTSSMRRHQWRGRTVQTLYLPLETSHSSAKWLEVTRVESALHRQLHELRWLLVLGILIGAGGAVGIGYGLARRALRPVAELTDAARDLQDQPSGTLPTNFGVTDELTNLAETFNDLLRRLRSMVARERRFRADAAHKMFTPLTAIQNEIDVTLRKPRTPSAYRKTLEKTRAHTEELSSMLDRLMALSRVEARDVGPADEAVNVTDRVQARVEEVRGRAREQDVGLSVSGPSGALVAVESRHLDTIVDALVDNAIKYTPAGGRVRVTVSQEGDRVCLSVSDTGIGFEDDEAGRLSDRFYRGDAASGVARGGGLGLSIVQALAQSYEGSLAAWSDGVGEGSVFAVRFPAA